VTGCIPGQTFCFEAFAKENVMKLINDDFDKSITPAGADAIEEPDEAWAKLKKLCSTKKVVTFENRKHMINGAPSICMSLVLKVKTAEDAQFIKGVAKALRAVLPDGKPSKSGDITLFDKRMGAWRRGIGWIYPEIAKDAEECVTKDEILAVVLDEAAYIGKPAIPESVDSALGETNESHSKKGRKALGV
jgi:hypothetical protein